MGRTLKSKCALGAFVVAMLAMPLLAFAQGNVSPEETRKRLEADKSRLDATQKRSKEIKADLDKIAEVRNTPVITIIENPEGSQRRVRTSLVSALAIALVLGLGLGASLAFSLDYLRVQREMNPHDFAQFTELGREAIPGFGAGRSELEHPAAVAERGGN